MIIHIQKLQQNSTFAQCCREYLRQIKSHFDIWAFYKTLVTLSIFYSKIFSAATPFSLQTAMWLLLFKPGTSPALMRSFAGIPCLHERKCKPI